MPNITLRKWEMVFLKEKILEKYCRIVNEPYLLYVNHLTGTLRHYELIAEKVTDYLADGNHIAAYYNDLENSAFKSGLTGFLQINGNKNQEYISVSADILRKLIFYGPENAQLAFRDFFVAACYIFIGVDRNLLIRQYNAPLPPGGSVTLKPEQYIPSGSTLGNGGTVHPYATEKKFTLTPVVNDMQNALKVQFTFGKDKVSLNRQNLDAENKTITSKVQAKIYYQDGSWYIENGSELKTTFIQVLKPTKLEAGDIIIFGNKQFVFEG